MTVGELRKALENVPDDMPVAMWQEFCYTYVDEARVLDLLESYEPGTGLGVVSTHPDAKRYFVIS